MRSLLTAFFLAVPALAFAAGGAEGEHDTAGPLIRHAINFVLLAALLFWAARKPVSDFLQFRQREIGEQLTKADEAKREANAKYQQLQDRLDDFGAELDALIQKTREDAAAERRGLLTHAEQTAKQIEAGAERSLQEELRRARTELRTEAADLAVRLAEEALRQRVGRDDHARLAAEYVTKLGETA